MYLFPLSTREMFVTGPEASVVCKTLVILVHNSIKVKPTEKITLGILEEQEREGKAFETKMG